MAATDGRTRHTEPQDERAHAGTALPPALRALIAGHRGRALVTRSGQLIYENLDPLTDVLLLSDGVVRLAVGSGPATRTTLLLRAPALFGDRDLLAGCAVSQDAAQALGPCRVLCLPAATFLSALAASAEVKAQVIGDALLRSARSARHAAFMAEPLEARVLALLYELHEHQGATLPRYEDLAALVGATAKSVGRTIAELESSTTLLLGPGRSFALGAKPLEDLAASRWLGLFHTFGAATSAATVKSP